MLYLTIAVLCSVAVSVLLKVLRHKGIDIRDRYQANYRCWLSRCLFTDTSTTQAWCQCYQYTWWGMGYYYRPRYFTTASFYHSWSSDCHSRYGRHRCRAAFVFDYSHHCSFFIVWWSVNGYAYFWFSARIFGAWCAGLSSADQYW